ncbi:5-oxoprolinase subunit PxpB [Sediminibacillus massiliensis]|uniref:5-oxoprolinase subunit PxpB n=1 Tax=Sediminibacillus massiliensis TaxID=1926277 RepID=UPI0009883028|nr:5-oxoprolinase subunit PxpB [Sediminibacillus massiliensis]
MSINFFPLSETSILIDFGKEISIERNTRIHQMAGMISERPFPGFIETVPAYTTLAVYFDPLAIDADNPFQTVCNHVESLWEQSDFNNRSTRKIELPVCYEGEFAPDLTEVADRNDLSVQEVINKHAETEYYVYFLGFAPGFPFLGGMDSAIATPRKSSPRRNVSAGSVGIAGQQTGVYPADSPGGWQIIGRTPTALFRPDAKQPALLQPGDRVKFYPITKKQFDAWEEE